jgi:hypothetical protein
MQPYDSLSRTAGPRKAADCIDLEGDLKVISWLDAGFLPVFVQTADLAARYVFKMPSKTGDTVSQRRDHSRSSQPQQRQQRLGIDIFFDHIRQSI